MLLDVWEAAKSLPGRVVLRAAIQRAGVDGGDRERVATVGGEVAGEQLRRDPRGGAALEEMGCVHRLDGSDQREHLRRKCAGGAIGQVRRLREEVRSCAARGANEHLRRS